MHQPTFNKILKEYWDMPNAPTGPDIFTLFTGGTIISSSEQDMGGFSVICIIIQKPMYEIDNDQLCRIMDEGNHCVSKGTIIYEDGYDYITWSNKGHI